MDLVKLRAELQSVEEVKAFSEQPSTAKFSFPLPADDYFMTIAILAQLLDAKV